MTIEERAIEYAKFIAKNGGRTAEWIYYSGATDQQKIDIDKACDWIRDNMSHFWHTDKKDEEYLIKQFKRAMEE